MSKGIIRVVCLMLTCLAPTAARAGVLVEAYHTIAETNGYAPFSKAQFYAQQELDNVSPATADASGDWTGTNAGGSTPTWHWIGSSHLSMVTNFDAKSINITGNGSFSFSIATTADFIQPTAINGVYQPGGAADYGFQFDIDAPASYSVSALLTGYSVAQLGSFAGTDIFDQVHRPSQSPFLFQQTGTIPPGRYQIRANASFGIDLPDGINNFITSGSFTDYSFALQLPEPNLGCGAAVVVAGVVALKRCHLKSSGYKGDWADFSDFLILQNNYNQTGG